MVQKVCLGVGTFLALVGLIFTIMTATIESWVLASVDGVEACAADGDSPLGSLGLYSATYDPACVAGVPEASSFEFFDRAETKTTEFFPLFPSQTAFGGALSDASLAAQGLSSFFLNAPEDVTTFEDCETTYAAGGPVEQRAAVLAGGLLLSGLNDTFAEGYLGFGPIAAQLTTELDGLLTTSLVGAISQYLGGLKTAVDNAAGGADVLAAELGFTGPGTATPGTINAVCGGASTATQCIAGVPAATLAGVSALSAVQIGGIQQIVGVDLANSGTCVTVASGGFADCLFGGISTQYDPAAADLLTAMLGVDLGDNPVFDALATLTGVAPYTTAVADLGAFVTFGPVGVILNTVCPSAATVAACGTGFASAAALPEDWDVDGEAVLGLFLDIGIENTANPTAPDIATVFTDYTVSVGAATSWNDFFESFKNPVAVAGLEAQLATATGTAALLAQALAASGFDLAELVNGFASIFQDCIAVPLSNSACQAEFVIPDPFIPTAGADTTFTAVPGAFAAPFQFCYILKIAGLPLNCIGATLDSTLDQIGAIHSVSPSEATESLNLFDAFSDSCQGLDATIAAGVPGGLDGFVVPAPLGGAASFVVTCVILHSNPTSTVIFALSGGVSEPTFFTDTWPQLYAILQDLGIDNFPSVSTDDTSVLLGAPSGTPGRDAAVAEDIANRISECEDNDEDIRRIELAQVLIPAAIGGEVVGLLLAVAAIATQKAPLAIVGGVLNLAGGVMTLSALLLVLNAPVYAAVGGETDPANPTFEAVYEGGQAQLFGLLGIALPILSAGFLIASAFLGKGDSESALQSKVTSTY